jgi:uncharacterized protein
MKITSRVYAAISIACFIAINIAYTGSAQTADFTRFHKLKITDVKPEGWIKEFLERQATGLTGNIEVAGYPFNTCLWACEKMRGSQAAWWPYEQTAYYIDGVHRLGLLLGDQRLIAKATVNTQYVINHLDSTGRFGTNLTDRWCRWPYASFNRNFMVDFELTYDTAIVKMLQKHYLTFTAKDFADDLELANVEELCWLYGITKDERLINMAKEAYHLFKTNIEYRNRAGADMVFACDKAPNHHGVVYLELVKIPAILYSYTGKKEYLDEAENGIKMMEKYDMLVCGLPSSTEHFQGISEVAGTEVCNTATFPYTYGYFLRITGEANLGDKIEKAVFNGGIGAVTKDFKAHQYFTMPNQVIAIATSNPFGHNPARMAFLPGHDVECCTGNVNRFMPYYVEQMWLNAPDNGLVAALFGPSSVQTTVGKSKIPVIITEATEYPFSEKIDFKFQTTDKVSFPFYIRIPDWCSKPEILVNGKPISGKITAGTFYKLERVFINGDVVTLKIPMEVKTSHWPDNGVALERGPLVYSLAISANKTVLKDYVKSTVEFPGWEMNPASIWNYALDLADEKPQVETSGKTGYPWDEGNSPIHIKVPAKKLDNWHLNKMYDEKWKLNVERTPSFPTLIESSEPTEYLELVPYGSTLLRLTVFPKLTK